VCVCVSYGEFTVSTAISGQLLRTVAQNDMCCALNMVECRRFVSVSRLLIMSRCTINTNTYKICKATLYEIG